MSFRRNTHSLSLIEAAYFKIHLDSLSRAVDEFVGFFFVLNVNDHDVLTSCLPCIAPQPTSDPLALFKLLEFQVLR
jgi:hypothetical protein